jgi:AraC-like DNA-binding protein
LHSEHFKLMRNWTIFLFSVAVLLFARIIISFISNLIYGEIITGNDFNILHAIIWMGVFVKVLVSPEILFGLPHLKKKVHARAEIKIKLDENWYFEKITIHNQQDLKLKSKIDDRLLALIAEIETLVRDHNYFRNQKITISDVANELSIPVSHLVYLFKYHSKMTFTEYKTFHKIEDAKLLIEGGFLVRNTLESLAAEVGFASYNPFFTAFKKLSGISPNDYSLRFQQQSLGNGSKAIHLSVVG